MLAKVKEQLAVYHGDRPPASQVRLYTQEAFQYDDYAVWKDFHGRHPSVMSARVAAARRGARRYNRWLNWRFYREVFRRGFRG